MDTNLLEKLLVRLHKIEQEQAQLKQLFSTNQQHQVQAQQLVVKEEQATAIEPAKNFVVQNVKVESPIDLTDVDLSDGVKNIKAESPIDLTDDDLNKRDGAENVKVESPIDLTDDDLSVGVENTDQQQHQLQQPAVNISQDILTAASLVSLPKTVASKVLVETETNIGNLMKKYFHPNKKLCERHGEYVLLPADFFYSLLASNAANAKEMKAIHEKLDIALIEAESQSTGSRPQGFKQIDNEEQLIEVDNKIGSDDNYRKYFVSTRHLIGTNNSELFISYVF